MKANEPEQTKKPGAAAEQEPKAASPRSIPEFPEGDISFLYEIPAIKSFKPIPQQGPRSQPGSIRIKIGDEGIKFNLWFDFR